MLISIHFSAYFCRVFWSNLKTKWKLRQQQNNANNGFWWRHQHLSISRGLWICQLVLEDDRDLRNDNSSLVQPDTSYYDSSTLMFVASRHFNIEKMVKHRIGRFLSRPSDSSKSVIILKKKGLFSVICTNYRHFQQYQFIKSYWF